MNLTFYERDAGLKKISLDPEVKKISARCFEEEIVPQNSVGHTAIGAENFEGDLSIS